MIERIDHVNLVVEDLAAMTAFYRDVLGLEVTKQITIRGGWIEAVTGLDRVDFRVGDLDAVVAALHAATAEPLSEIREVPTTQVDFEGQQKRIVYCRDPEGNLLELCAFS